nr:TPA_inf: conotoxin precursor SF-mi2 [Conus judaeus]
MRFYLLLTVTLLLTSFTGGDAGSVQGKKAQGRFVRRDCNTGCVPCGDRCCCVPHSCIDSKCLGHATPHRAY